MGSFLYGVLDLATGYFSVVSEVVINLTKTRQSLSVHLCFPIKLVMYLPSHGDNITIYFLILNTNTFSFYFYSLNFVVTRIVCKSCVS